MKLQGAIVKEQGVTFSIVIVKPTAMQTASSIDSTRAAFQHLFPSPLILASQDSSGRFKYQGRKDVVAFLARLDPSRIPWKEYSVN